MKVFVEECWSGNDKIHARITTLDGRRFRCNTDGLPFPSRAMSTEMLNMLEAEGYTRASIRFEYR